MDLSGGFLGTLLLFSTGKANDSPPEAEPSVETAPVLTWSQQIFPVGNRALVETAPNLTWNYHIFPVGNRALVEQPLF